MSRNFILNRLSSSGVRVPSPDDHQPASPPSGRGGTTGWDLAPMKPRTRCRPPRSSRRTWRSPRAPPRWEEVHLLPLGAATPGLLAPGGGLAALGSSQPSSPRLLRVLLLHERRPGRAEAAPNWSSVPATTVAAAQGEGGRPASRDGARAGQRLRTRRGGASAQTLLCAREGCANATGSGVASSRTASASVCDTRQAFDPAQHRRDHVAYRHPVPSPGAVRHFLKPSSSRKPVALFGEDRKTRRAVWVLRPINPRST